MAGKNLITEIRALIDGDATPLPPPEKSRLQLDKWRLIHKHVHGHPFPTNTRLSRSLQWCETANHIRDMGLYHRGLVLVDNVVYGGLLHGPFPG